MSERFRSSVRLFGVTLAAIFLAELGDKTQLATLAFAAQTPGYRAVVFAAAGAALVFSALVGVLVGDLLARLVKPRVINLIAGIVFVGCAGAFAWQFATGGGESAPAGPQAAEGDRTPWEMFAATFVAIFVAELGDKTQLATLSLAAGNRQARWVVFCGSSAALVGAAGLACLLGGWLGDRLESRYLSLMAAGVFGAVGVAFLFGRAEKGRREFAWLVEQIEGVYGEEKCRACPRFMKFLDHIEAIGSPTVSRELQRFRGSLSERRRSDEECQRCKVEVLHAGWHERHDHKDQVPLERG